MNWGCRLQGGQPITSPCPLYTATATGCYDILVPGQDPNRGMHIDSNGQPSFLGNPGAFNQPCVWEPLGRPDFGPQDAFRLMVALACLGWLSHPDCRTALSSGWISPPSRTSSSANASTCSSELSSSTFSTTRTSTLPISAATELWPFRGRATSQVRTLAKSVPLAMLPTIRDRSSSL